MTKSNKTKLAIITALLCMMMLPVLACGITYCASTSLDTLTVNYFDQSGQLVKTENVKQGSLTGIYGYNGTYQVNTHKDKEQYLTFVVPDDEYVEANFGPVRSDGSIPTRWEKDKNITDEELYNRNPLICFCYENYKSDKYPYGGRDDPYSFTLETSSLFGCDKPVVTNLNNGYSTVSRPDFDGVSKTLYWSTVRFDDTPLRPEFYTYLPYTENIGKTFEVTNIKTQDTQEYIYYNQIFNNLADLNSCSILADTAQSGVINVYTTYEQSITPPSPQDPTPSVPNTPSGTVHAHEANIQALKTQWNALLQGDFKTACGWQLISTATAVAVASVAIIVLIWFGAVKLNKMKRKAKFSNRKRR